MSAEPAVVATRQVMERARVAYGRAMMRPTECEQLTYQEYLAANPEAARRRQTPPVRCVGPGAGTGHRGRGVTRTKGAASVGDATFTRGITDAAYQ